MTLDTIMDDVFTFVVLGVSALMLVKIGMLSRADELLYTIKVSALLIMVWMGLIIVNQSFTRRTLRELLSKHDTS